MHCLCVNVYCHRVTTKLQFIYIYIYIYHIINYFLCELGRDRHYSIPGAEHLVMTSKHQSSVEPLIWIFELMWVSADAETYYQCYSKEGKCLSQTATVAGNGTLSSMEIQRSLLPHISYSLILSNTK